MNCSAYVFGELFSGFNQYPEDNSSLVYQNIFANCKAPTQVIVSRDDALMRYCYIRKISNNKYIGISVLVTGYYISTFKELFSLFEATIDKMSKDGIGIKYSEQGELVDTEKKLSSQKEDLDGILNDLLDSFIALGKAHVLPKTDYSVSKSSIKEFEVSADKQDMVKASYTYGFTCIYKSKDFDTIRVNSYRSILNRISGENAILKTENKKLYFLNKKINRQKKQFKYIIILILVVLICCVLLLLFYREAIKKTEDINRLEKTIKQKDSINLMQKQNISNLNDKIRNLDNTIDKFKQFTFNTGSTIRTNDSGDNAWIMWIRANCKLQIKSFYLRSTSNAANVTIGLYDSEDNLISKVEHYVSNTFSKVHLNSEWTINTGVYYLRITDNNGISLQYHSSNNGEYEQFAGGALEILGCCNYESRKESGSRNKHGYYQYFYDINYILSTEQYSVIN